MSTELGGVVNATKKLVMAGAVTAVFMMMTACASGKSIKQGADEFSIPEAKYHKALSQYDDGDYFESITTWTELLEDTPEFAEGQYNLGLIYDKLNMVPEAIQHYELAVQDLENSLDLHNGTRKAVEDSNNSKAALALYNMHLGAAYMRDGRVDEAIVTLNKTLTDDPYNAMAHYNLAAAYMAHHNYDDALLQADTAVDLLAKPDHNRDDGLAKDVDRERLGNYLLRQAACHIAREEWDKARTALERAEKQCGTKVPAKMWDDLDAPKSNPEKPEKEEGSQG